MCSPIFGSNYCSAQSTAADDAMNQLKAAAGDKGAGLTAPRDPRIIVANSVRVILEFLGVIALVLVIYAGFLWMTAGGNEEKVTKAKNIITAAVIGLIITMAAYAITSFVTNRVSGNNNTNCGGSCPQGQTCSTTINTCIVTPSAAPSSP